MVIEIIHFRKYEMRIKLHQQILCQSSYLKVLVQQILYDGHGCPSVDFAKYGKIKSTYFAGRVD